MALYTKTFSTTCPGLLLDALNDDASIPPLCIQIVNNGAVESIFEFVTTLSTTEESNLDAFLAAWVCPTNAEDTATTTEEVVNDTLPADPNILWSSEKIMYEIANASSSGSCACEFKFVEDLSWSQTSSTSYRQKIRLTTDNLPAGLYRIGWNYRYWYGSTGRDFLGRVQLNDSITLTEHKQEPKDTGSDQKLHNSGFAYYSLSGINTIDIDYCSSSSSYTAMIAEARLEIWKVDETNTTYTPGSVPGNRPSVNSDDDD